ncbi:MAG TPA: nitroreductase family protein, partial [Acidimicrobiales bacterium]|nr:nitroreductase family protein [Acidimicrobiales bacterium]
MEFEKALMARRMVRNFKSDLIPEHLLETIVASSLRTPSAGFTQGVELVVLQGNETHTYWECTTTEQWRKSTSRKGLFNAPVVIILICDPEAYAARYSEPDKAESGLGAIGAWDVPYWWMDTGMTAFALMLSAFDK